MAKFLTTLLAAMLLTASVLPAQQAHVTAQTTTLTQLRSKEDSVQTLLCTKAPKNAPGYVKTACAIQQRARLLFPQLFAAESALVAVTPPPAPTVSTVTVTGTSPLLVSQTAQFSAVVKDQFGSVMTVPVTWASNNTAVATVSTTGIVTAVAAGTSTITASVNGISGSFVVVDTAATVVVTPPPPTSGTGEAELPRSYVNTALSATPSTGRRLLTGLTGSVQAALDSSRAGDIIVVDCSRGIVNEELHWRKNSTVWTTLKSDCDTRPSLMTFPGEGVRMDSVTGSKLPQIVSPTPSGALNIDMGAGHLRVIGLGFSNAASIGSPNGTILIGSAGIEQNTLALMPTNIILDRIYLQVPLSQDDRRCITFNGGNLALIDSYVSGCKSIYDSQAIAATNGTGPFKISNNYLDATGENIAFGGADTGIPGLVPCDMEITRNHITKRLYWNTTSWLEKNIIESKNSCRVLFEANVLEHSWNNGQVGYTFMLWSANQDGKCPQCVTSDWTIRNNLILDANSGPATTCCWSPDGVPLVAPANHLTFRNNLWVATGSGRGFSISDTPYLVIDHNTIISGDAVFILAHDTRVPKAKGLRISNNVAAGYYAIFSAAGGGQYAVSYGADTDAVVTNNVLFQSTGQVPWLYQQAGNFYPTAWDFLVGSQTSLDPTQYALRATSAYKGQATDGKDPGADVPSVLSATSGVVRQTP